MRNGTPSGVHVLALCAAAGLLGAPGSLTGQGPGSTGAELLRMDPGARSATFGGAYTAEWTDPDAIFYNPASAGWLGKTVGIGFQPYVEDVTVGSAAAAFAFSRFALGAGIQFLNAGEIDVIEPDPLFGGERGEATGETAGATETAARLAGAARFLGGRAAVGASAGFVTNDLAGAARSAVFFDVGAQYHLGALAVGASARNIGSALSGAEGDAPLPREARAGAGYRYVGAGGVGVTGAADVVYGLEDQTLGFALGGEAGLVSDDGVTALLRFGLSLGEGEAHLGRARFGGGLGYRRIRLDYAIQVLEYLGPIHRFSLRWSAPD